MFSLSVFEEKYPFYGKFVSKNQKLFVEAETYNLYNSNM